MTCKEHSNYKGIGKPIHDCVDCWKIYCKNQEHQIMYLEQRLREIKKEAEEKKEEQNKTILLLNQKLRKAEKKLKDSQVTLHHAATRKSDTDFG